MKLTTAPVRSLAAAIALLVCGVATTHAAVLITVDITNSTAVVFSATGAFSAVDDISSEDGAGVTLLQFFQSNSTLSGDPITITSLTPAGSGTSEYDSAGNDFGTVSLEDINLYVSGGSVTQVFTTTSSAFTGVAVLDLSGLDVPTLGTEGDIIVGDTFSGSGVVIGSWIAVPEPSVIWLLAVTVVGTFILRTTRQVRHPRE